MTEWDRDAIPFDEKMRVLDLTSYKFQLPEVGIYDGKVRYYKANLEWAKIIEGHVSWLASIAAWQDAEDENYQAIQEILIFLRGVEMVTKEEMQEAICEGIQCATVNLAKRLVSGSTGGFTIDDDGNIVDGGEDAELPDDDPATVDIDERKASQFAGYIAISLRVNDLLAYLHALYGPVVSPVTSAADAKILVDARYLTVASMDTAIDAYWASRAASISQIVSSDREDLANYLYCNRFGGSTVETVKNFFAQLTGPTNEAILNAIGIMDGLGDEQYSIWYNQGAATRSTEYKSAPCEPIETYSFTLQFNTTFNDTHTLKAYHRYEVTVVGLGQDVDGDMQDAFWHVQTGQNPVFDPVDFSIQIGLAVKTKPDVFEAPYNAASHSYKWSIDMGSGNASPQWTINRDGTMSVATTSPTGGFLVEVVDLGQYR